jgi:hypothetical protein
MDWFLVPLNGTMLNIESLYGNGSRGRFHISVVLLVIGAIFTVLAIQSDTDQLKASWIVVWSVLIDVLVMHNVFWHLIARFSISGWRMSILHDPLIIINFLLSLWRIKTILDSAQRAHTFKPLILSSSISIWFSIGVTSILKKLDSVIVFLGNCTLGIHIRVTLFTCRLLVIRKCFKGTETRVCASMTHLAIQRDICSICHECLSAYQLRKSSSSAHSRANLSLNRLNVHGSSTLFSTSCGHVFHRDCLMRWVSEKPIRIDLTLNPQVDARLNSSRLPGDQATCPLCKSPIELQVSNHTFYTFRLLVYGGI